MTDIHIILRRSDHFLMIMIWTGGIIVMFKVFSCVPCTLFMNTIVVKGNDGGDHTQTYNLMSN